MRLLIREYLSMLKESKELDFLVPQLLLAMKIKPIYTPQIGVRQQGVDVHAFGIDPEDGKEKNFLITIKDGDVDRGHWDTGEQAIRPSLNDIRDAYITKKLGKKFKKFNYKVILCCGGEVKQAQQDNWEGYVEDNSTRKREYALWDGNALSIMIQDYLFDEFLFLGDSKVHIRRTIALLADPDYELDHFKLMIDELLENKKIFTSEKKLHQKNFLRMMSTVKLCLGLIREYSKEEGCLKHAVFSSEYVLLKFWDFICKNDLYKKKKVINEYYDTFSLYFKASADYFNVIEEHCFVRDGIVLSCRSSTTSSMVCFEQIGILVNIGIIQFLHGFLYKEEIAMNNARSICSAIEGIIENNSISGSPCFDDNTIEITSTLYFLTLFNRKEFAKKWISEIIQRFHFSYKIIGTNFPISRDDIDTLLEFEHEGKYTKEEMVETSTLLATLAYWCAMLGFTEEYESILVLIEDQLQHTDLQIWYPLEGIKGSFFNRYSGDEGVSEVPIHLPKTIDELKSRVKDFLSFKNDQNFESDWKEVPAGLPFVASRVFRTPVVPFLWINGFEV